jgi:hypothetical protein
MSVHDPRAAATARHQVSTLVDSHNITEVRAVNIGGSPIPRNSGLRDSEGVPGRSSTPQPDGKVITMHLQKFTTAVAVLAATAGASAFATSAQAAIIDNDPVTLGIADPAHETFKGNLAFDWTRDIVTPHLTGTLTYDEGNHACFRVSLTSYDRNNQQIDYKHGAPYCPTDDDSHSKAIDLTGTSAQLLQRVAVAVEEEDAKGGWQANDSYDLYYVTPHDDLNVTVSDTNYTADGEILWGLDPNNKSIGTWRGSLTLAGATKPGRISLRYLDDKGNQVDRVDGPTITPDEHGNYYSYKELSAAASSSALKIKIVLQTQNSDLKWADGKSTTVSFAE